MELKQDLSRELIPLIVVSSLMNLSFLNHNNPKSVHIDDDLKVRMTLCVI